MKKFFDWMSKIIPTVWGVLWMLIITFGSIAVAVAVIKWFLSLVGVL